MRGAHQELPVSLWNKLMGLGAAGSILCWASLVWQRRVPGCLAPHPGSQPNRAASRLSARRAVAQALRKEMLFKMFLFWYFWEEVLSEL